MADEASPRPWRLSLPDDTLILDANGDEVCRISGEYADEWERMEANASLIVEAVNKLHQQQPRNRGD